jgi:carboxypeptidase family protein
LLFALGATAQTPTGTLRGAITDPSGGAILGVTVRVVNTSTNGAKEFKTDAGGRYVIPFLSPGLYTVSVKATGFRESRESAVKIDVGQVRSIDFRLQIG